MSYGFYITCFKSIAAHCSASLVMLVPEEEFGRQGTVTMIPKETRGTIVSPGPNWNLPEGRCIDNFP